MLKDLLSNPSQSQKLRLRARSKEASDTRSLSPDIEAILSSTPKPQPGTKSNGQFLAITLANIYLLCFFHSEKGRTRLRNFANVSALSDKSLLDGVPSAFRSVGASRKRRASESSGPEAGKESWVDHGFGFPGEQNRGRQHMMSNEVTEGGEFGEVEPGRDEMQDTCGDSDSSLDLHTPLPYIFYFCFLKVELIVLTDTGCCGMFYCRPTQSFYLKACGSRLPPALGGDGRSGRGMSFISASVFKFFSILLNS